MIKNGTIKLILKATCVWLLATMMLFVIMLFVREQSLALFIKGQISVTPWPALGDFWLSCYNVMFGRKVGFLHRTSHIDNIPEIQDMAGLSLIASSLFFILSVLIYSFFHLKKRSQPAELHQN